MKDMLYQKYHVVKAERITPFEGQYFVLNPQKDLHARRALEVYAARCEEEYPLLASSIREWLNKIALQQELKELKAKKEMEKVADAEGE